MRCQRPQLAVRIVSESMQRLAIFRRALNSHTVPFSWSGKTTTDSHFQDHTRKRLVNRLSESALSVISAFCSPQLGWAIWGRDVLVVNASPFFAANMFRHAKIREE